MRIELILGLVIAACGWLLALLGWFVAFRLLFHPTPPPTAPPTEEAPPEQEDAGRSAQYAEWGRQGAAKAKAMKADFEACLAKGRSLLARPGSIEEKKAGLMALINEYPHVAENVARKLNREMSLSKRLGISEDMLLQEVAGLVKNALASKSAPAAAGGFGGERVFS